jgi:transposase-like protein
MRETMAFILQKLMEAEVTAKIGAQKYERTDERNNHRNRYRTRPYETRLGTIDLKIPKLREGSYFPSFLEPPVCGKKPMVNVIQEPMSMGISTRKVDELVQALGMDGIDKKYCIPHKQELDEICPAVCSSSFDTSIPIFIAGCNLSKGP